MEILYIMRVVKMKIEKFCIKFLDSVNEKMENEVNSIIFMEVDKEKKIFGGLKEAKEYFKNNSVKDSLVLIITTKIPLLFQAKKGKVKKFESIGKAVMAVFTKEKEVHFAGNPINIDDENHIFSFPRSEFTAYSITIEKAKEEVIKKRDVSIFLHELQKN